MKDPQQPEEVVAYNEESLRTLSRAIVLSRKRFSLILVRCNYARLQAQMQQQLKERCPVPIRELVLHGSTKTLYTLIKTELGDEQPQALMIVGLDAVTALDDVLTATNQVRDDFRKSFAFPLVLWLNDEILQKLGRLAPDFNSWAGVPIRFAIATTDLVQFLQQQTDALFEQAMQVGAGRFPRSSALYLGTNTYAQPDLKVALRELHKRQQPLDSALEAGIQFILALDAHANDRLDEAYPYYQQSLAFWRSTLVNSSEIIQRRSCVLFYLGLWWRRQAALYRAEYESDCRQARDYYRQCVDGLLQTNHEALAAKFIIALGEVLQRLGEWDELSTVAQTTVRLHQTYFDPICLAYGYGLLAEVALARSAWQEAEQHAAKALQVNEQPPAPSHESHERYLDLSWARPHYRSLYLLLRAQAQQQLGLLSDAVDHLEAAKESCNHAYDPLLYTRILEALRSLYYEQGDYLNAFETKREQRSIEQQYSLRAFIGAGRLKPERQVISPALVALELPEIDDDSEQTIAPTQPIEIAQEISASGRQRDVEQLIARLSSSQHKLTVIHGQSGVGKSSIINAGLVPALEQRPIEARNPLAIVLSVYTDWSRELGSCLVKALERRGIHWTAIESADSLDPQFFIEQFRNNADRWSLLPILIFDQFEEFFFFYPDAASRRSFFQFFGECLNLPYVKVVLSLREDYLHYLLECERLQLDEITNDILGRENRYPLGNFTTQDAKLIIQRLTQRSQFSLEDDLIERLVADMARESGDVRPIELQIVGAQLQEDNISKLHQYQALGENPKGKLVERFLEQVVKDCGPPNEEAAHLILYLLTDEKGTRPLKTLLELTENLSKLAVHLTLNAEQLDLILTILVRSGLVLLLPEVPAARYQLVHDYLVALIRQKQQPVLLNQIQQQQHEIQQLERDKAFQEQQQQLLRRDRQRAVVAAAIGSLLTLIAGGFASLAHSQARRAAIAEIQAKTSESSALFYSGDRFQALIASIQATQRLQDIRTPLAVEIATLGQLQRSLFSVQEFNRLTGHEQWVNQVSFTRDGQQMVSASDDNTVRLWRADGQLLRTFVGHGNRVNSVSISPDGQTIASASDDKTVRLWRTDGTALKELPHDGYVTSVSISPDGQMIVSGSDDGTVRLWSIDGRALRPPLTEHNDRVKAVSFSPDGQTIASASLDGTVILWNRGGLALQRLHHQGQTIAVSFSPNSQTIASGGTDADGNVTVKLWNRNGQELETLTGHAKLINEEDANPNLVRSISFRSDGDILATTDSNGSVLIWKRDQPSGLFAADDPQMLKINRVTSATFSPDGTLASTDGENLIRRWRLDSAEPKVFEVRNGTLTSISFSPDGNMIAIGAGNDRPDGQTTAGKLLLQSFDRSLSREFSVRGSVDSVSFSPDGSTIATVENFPPQIELTPDGKVNRANPPGQIGLWSRSGSLLNRFEVAGKISSISYAPDMRSANGQEQGMIAAAVTPNSPSPTGQDTGRIVVWSLDGIKLLDFVAHQAEIRSIHFSPDGKTLASGGTDNTIKVWSLEGEFLMSRKSHVDAVNSIRFSPNGQILASASDDTTIKLWNREEDELRTLTGHTGSVRSIDFSPNGELLVSASDDGTIKVWNVEDRRILATLRGSGSEFNSVSFHPDDFRIAAVSTDGAVTLWSFDRDLLLKQSCEWIKDYVENLPADDDRRLCR